MTNEEVYARIKDFNINDLKYLRDYLLPQLIYFIPFKDLVASMREHKRHCPTVIPVVDDWVLITNGKDPEAIPVSTAFHDAPTHSSFYAVWIYNMWGDKHPRPLFAPWVEGDSDRLLESLCLSDKIAAEILRACIGNGIQKLFVVHEELWENRFDWDGISFENLLSVKHDPYGPKGHPYVAEARYYHVRGPWT